ncbi:BofC C-terminal domain-containing protein [Paenibacillus sp. MMS18-CY102]|uniref:BofC C-terminal domain-containing protein n=1 Tax=Paenibacillus sp. MMS18-CY102 TaxID=2682849 RepID=UPI001365478D|nr:BofC C-terminal domain-containing protein [Paenibacillus sp. MMS18-CY102]MWC28770.1 regulator [Paenibacillus sp. MMS18-CY102]
MKAFSLWKQLKRKLRRSGRPMWTLGSIAAIVSYSLLSGFPIDRAYGAATDQDASMEPKQLQEIIRSISMKQGPLKVHIHRSYICGEEFRSLGLRPPAEAVRLVKRPTVLHVRLDVPVRGEPTLQLEEQVSDLSVQCKESAMFGIDPSGRLTLFEGPPKKENAVRTFYQLDVRFMESHLPKEEWKRLVDGIRVEDKASYYSVLSSFSDFAIDASRNVMNPSSKRY